MFEKIGGLKKYWHVIALSNELKNNKSLKRKIYGIPLILWRDSKGKPNSLFDVCPHKRAPLQVKDFQKNEVFCTYHGWEFSKNGEILKIPSSPNLVGKLSCKCNKVEIEEDNGFIWVLLEKENESTKNIPNFSGQQTDKWKNYYNLMEFETTDELLIENFMDTTHTPIVHNKIIRDNDKKTNHDIRIIQENEKLKAEFGEKVENVGLGINSIIGNKLKISHIDEFILPNIVKVNYQINKKDRFQAIIVCTPIEDGKTMGFLKISYNFGFLNFVLGLFLPFIAKKVLKQDFDITKTQYENIKIFKNIKENDIDYDSLHNRVRAIRKNVINGKELNANNSQNINLIV